MPNIIECGKCEEGLIKIQDSSVDVIICDPPYNDIGEDLGDGILQMKIEDYVKWSLIWLGECKRILKDTGTMYVYGFSEILAHLFININIEKRWLVWHYTNKNMPGNPFWQRSHESIIAAFKTDKRIFNKDDVREPYTEEYVAQSGKKRTSTKGRMGSKETVYNVNEKGALPRDVIKISALAGGAGSKEKLYFCEKCDRIFFGTERKGHEHEVLTHPTQKPFELTKKLLMASKPKNKGFVVIPFSGTGSESYVSALLGMDSIAFDTNSSFVRMGKALLKTLDKKERNLNFFDK